MSNSAKVGGEGDLVTWRRVMMHTGKCRGRYDLTIIMEGVKEYLMEEKSRFITYPSRVKL